MPGGRAERLRRRYLVQPSTLSHKVPRACKRNVGKADTYLPRLERPEFPIGSLQCRQRGPGRAATGWCGGMGDPAGNFPDRIGESLRMGIWGVQTKRNQFAAFNRSASDCMRSWRPIALRRTTRRGVVGNECGDSWGEGRGEGASLSLDRSRGILRA